MMISLAPMTRPFRLFDLLDSLTLRHPRLFDPFDLFAFLPPSTPSTFNNRHLTLNTIYVVVYREGKTGVNHPGSGR